MSSISVNYTKSFGIQLPSLKKKDSLSRCLSSEFFQKKTSPGLSCLKLSTVNLKIPFSKPKKAESFCIQLPSLKKKDSLFRCLPLEFYQKKTKPGLSCLNLPATNLKISFSKPKKAVETPSEFFGDVALAGADVIGDIANVGSLLFNDPVANGSLGVTTVFNLVAGPLEMRDGLKDFQEAAKTQDVAGRAEGGLKVAKGSAQGIAGALYIPGQALNIVAKSTASKVAEVAGRTLGSVSGGVSIVASWIQVVLSSFGLHRHRVFYTQLHGFSADEQCLASLQADLKNSEKELGLKKVMSGELIKEVSEAKSDQAREVVQKVIAENRKNLILSAIVLGLSILAVAAGILALVGVSVGGLALTLVVGVGSLAVDLYRLIKAFQKGEVGRYDKLLIFISTVLCIAAVGVIAVASGGLVPLLLAGGIALLWLLINLFSYIHIRYSGS